MLVGAYRPASAVDNACMESPDTSMHATIHLDTAESTYMYPDTYVDSYIYQDIHTSVRLHDGTIRPDARMLGCKVCINHHMMFECMHHSQQKMHASKLKDACMVATYLTLVMTACMGALIDCAIGTPKDNAIPNNATRIPRLPIVSKMQCVRNMVTSNVLSSVHSSIGHRRLDVKTLWCEYAT